MKLKATIVALVLGTSSIAMARPATVRGSAGVTVSAQASFSVGTRTQARPPVQNGPRRVKRPVYNPRPVYEPAYYPTPAPQPVYEENVWVEEGPTFQALGTNLKIEGSAYNRDLGFTGNNSWNKVRIEARGSVTQIDEVRVTYLSGETQTIKVGELLSGNEMITLDLDGRNRQVTRVLVYGKSKDGPRSNGFTVSAR
jgi:hypothetical protein